MPNDPVTATSSGSRVVVHVQPRSSRSEIAGRHGDAVKIRVRAPPVDGAANEEVALVLAEALGVSPRAVRLVAGGADRRKVLEVTGLSPAAVRQALGFVFGTPPA